MFEQRVRGLEIGWIHIVECHADVIRWSRQGKENQNSLT
jgi:hypothetical protein